MARIPEFEARAARRGMPDVELRTGVPEVWQSLAQASAQFANKVGRYADEAAQMEGYYQGLEDAGKFQVGSPSLPPPETQGEAGAAPVAGGSGTVKVGGNVQRQIWNFFAGKNLQPHQIAAIMATISKESSFRPDVAGDNGQSIGLFQMNPAGGRQGRFLARAGPSWRNNINAQLEAWWQESLNEEKASGDRLRSARTIEEATEAMLDNIRPLNWLQQRKGGWEWSKRNQAAGRFLTLRNVASTPEPAAITSPKVAQEKPKTKVVGVIKDGRVVPVEVPATTDIVSIAGGAGPGAGPGSEEAAKPQTQKTAEGTEADPKPATVAPKVEPASAPAQPESTAPAMQGIVLRRGWTIRDQAYDRAALGMAADRLDSQMRTAMDQIATRYASEPEKIAPAIQAYAREQRTLIAKMPELQGDFDRLVASYTLAGTRSAAAVAEKTRKDERETAFLEANEQRRTGIVRLAQQAGTDDAGAQTIAAELAAYDAWLGQEESLTPKERQTAKQTLTQDVVRANVLGNFNRLETAVDRENYVKGFEQAWLRGDGNEMGLTEKTYRSIAKDMRAQVKRDQTAATKAGKVISKQIDSLFDMAAKGHAVPPDQMAKLKASVETTPSEALAHDWDFFEDFVDWQTNARMARPEEIEAQIVKLDAQRSVIGWDEDAIKQREGMVKLHDAIADGLKSDPLALAEAVGLVPPVKPIDLGANAVPALQDRQTTAETVAEHYGIDPVYFKRAEVTELTKSFAKEPDAFVPFAIKIQQAFGTDDGIRAMEQFSKDAPALANIAATMMATGDDRLVREAAEALKLKNIKNYSPVKVTEGIKSVIAHDALGPSLRLLPDQQQMAIDTADLLFDVRAHSAGIDMTSDEGKVEAGEIYAKALNDALGFNPASGQGGIGLVNGVMTAVPAKHTAEEIETALRSLNNDDLLKLPPIKSNNGIPVTAQQLNEAHLVTMGHDVYAVALGNPADDATARYLLNPDGTPYTLKASALIGVTAGRQTVRQSLTDSVISTVERRAEEVGEFFSPERGKKGPEFTTEAPAMTPAEMPAETFRRYNEPIITIDQLKSWLGVQGLSLEDFLGMGASGRQSQGRGGPRSGTTKSEPPPPVSSGPRDRRGTGRYIRGKPADEPGGGGGW